MKTDGEARDYQKEYRERPENREKARLYHREYGKKYRTTTVVKKRSTKPRDKKVPVLVREQRLTSVTAHGLQVMNVEQLANTVTAIMNGRVVLSM